MKYCPTCQNQYTDDAMSFCLQDGTPLVSGVRTAPTANDSWQEPETLISQNPPNIAANNPVRIDIQQSTPSYTAPQNYQQPSQPVEKKSRTGLIVGLLAIGLLLILGAIGGIGAILYYSPNTQIASNHGGSINSTPFGNSNSSNANSNSNSNTNSATPTPSATPSAKPTIKPAEVTAIKDNVTEELDAWKSASEDKNLDVNMSHYADLVDYYKGGKVSANKIRGDKQKAYDKYDYISINLENVKVTPDPSGDKATATFDKTWEFNNDDSGEYNKGSVQQQLILAKQGGKWKIVSEKELKVYYIDKSQ